VTATLQDRINRLQAATAYGPALEQLMLREPVLSVAATATSHPGASVTFVVVFESRRQAILKPFGGQNPNACANYNQDTQECLTHEVVAWRLAHALGDPYDQLLPTAVLRDVPGAGPGVLVNFRDGGADPAVFNEAPAQAYATAFWDALIGQQDRHGANFRYDPTARRLAAIDSAFAFARPGDFINNGSMFIEYRHGSSDGMLDDDEKNALQQLADHDLYGVRDFLARDRGDALRDRVDRMLASGRLPASGEF
jgi:hypothetical protein